MHRSTRFALVGPGRAGTALTEALTRAGWTLTAVAGRGRDAPSVVDAARRFDADASALVDAGRGAELVVIATPDGAIADAAVELADSVESGALVVHLAGSSGLEPFAALARLRPDVRFGACHPLMTLVGTPADVDRLGEAWFAVEGDRQTAGVATAIGGRTFRVDERATYHAAACVASNHLVALLGQVQRLAHQAGVPAEAFLPLVRATFDNVEARGAAASLTGPVARGDAGTVATHLDVLPEAERGAYRALARDALRLTDLPPAAERAITDLLEGVPVA